ncbi:MULTISPECIES: hypothetical protein [unclassified Microcoleus]|uniref:hypothetical protein n=1 Tax=unclassified Microcoleus TaxID=2642155 RepID=UPI002FCEE2D2
MLQPTIQAARFDQFRDRTFSLPTPIAYRIQLNITQHFGFHLIQILQHDFDVWKLKIFRQLANPVVKGLISVLEVQLHIPPSFPQSQQADGDIE